MEGYKQSVHFYHVLHGFHGQFLAQMLEFLF